MDNFLKYFLNGAKNSITIGVPDFQTNNQNQDMKNIANDFSFSYGRILKDAKKTKSARTN